MLRGSNGTENRKEQITEGVKNHLRQFRLYANTRVIMVIPSVFLEVLQLHGFFEFKKSSQLSEFPV